jgi:type I restriction enzyme S subunit
MKKLQPKLRFSGFDGDWTATILKNVALIFDGTHQTPKYTTNGIPFVSVESIDYIDSPVKFISQEAFKSDFKIKPQKNDILMTRITAGIIGATAIVKNDNPLAYYVSLALIRINVLNINVHFLEQNIKSNTFRQELHKRIIHIAFPKKINLNEIGLCKLSYPTLPEQTKIATFLSIIDEKIRLLKENKSLLTEYKKGTMQKIFSQEIRFKDDNGKAFEEWKDVELSEIANINKGNQLNKDDLNDFDKYPSISGGIEPSGYTNKFNRNENTIIISEGGNSCGYVNFIKNKFWCGGHCYSIDIIDKKINILYLYQLLKYNQIHIMMLRVGSGLPNIQKKDLKKYNLSISKNIKEQTRIANFLSAIDEKISLVNNQIGDTQEYKKGLLQQLFV